jgi:hypothetical protein
MSENITLSLSPVKRGEQNFFSTWAPAVNTPYTERVKRCAIIGYSQGKINYTQCHLPIANKCISCFNRFKGEAREVIGHLRNEPVTGSDTWTANNIKLSVCARILLFLPKAKDYYLHNRSNRRNCGDSLVVHHVLILLSRADYPRISWL